MNDTLEIGQYGEAHFCSKHTRIHAFGKITDLDLKFVEFTDNDGFPYILKRKGFEFERCEFKPVKQIM
jgi:hypothetical protein